METRLNVWCFNELSTFDRPTCHNKSCTGALDQFQFYNFSQSKADLDEEIYLVEINHHFRSRKLENTGKEYV